MMVSDGAPSAASAKHDSERLVMYTRIGVAMTVAALVLAACSAEDVAQLAELASEFEDAAVELQQAADGVPVRIVPTVEARLSLWQEYQGQLVSDYTATLTERYRGLYSGATVAENRGEWSGYLACNDGSTDDGYWKGDWSSPLRLGEATLGTDEGQLLVKDAGDALLVAYAPPLVLPFDTPPECVELDGEVFELYFPWADLTELESPVPGYPAVLQTPEGEGLLVALVPKGQLESGSTDLSASYRAAGTDENGPFDVSLDVTIRLQPAG